MTEATATTVKYKHWNGQDHWPADAVTKVDIQHLVPYAKNARTHTDEQVSQIMASMKEWGWTNPVLIDEENMIIAGHGRVMAAQRLGLTEIPCIVARGWSESQKKAYVLADNKLALNAGWNVDLLTFELEDLLADGFDMPLIGFDDDELAKFLNSGTEGETDPDEVPDVPVEPEAQLGDIYILGNHRLICGDSTQVHVVEALLGSVKPHLMVTDPPYGVEYDPKWRVEAGVSKNTGKMGKVLNDDRADWSEAWSLFPGNVVYVWHGGLHASTVSESLISCGFSIRSQIIWVKDRFALSRGHYHWQHEPCWYAVRNTAQWEGDRKQSTVWEIPAREDSGFGHGTQKPVECMKRPIENNSSPGQAIYEPFSGSGTTIIAAEMTGRHCYAIELNPAYVDVAVKRWENFTGQKAVKAEADGVQGTKARRKAKGVKSTEA